MQLCHATYIQMKMSFQNQIIPNSISWCEDEMDLIRQKMKIKIIWKIISKLFWGTASKF